jgi:hypothetical protein
VITSKEATPISGNLTFQVSPDQNLLLITFITLMYFMKLKGTLFILEVLLVLVVMILIFLCDKHAGSLIKQFRIFYNDNTITENLDFVYVTNILCVTIPDSIKSCKPKTFTPITSLVPSGNPNHAIGFQKKSRMWTGY